MRRAAPIEVAAALILVLSATTASANAAAREACRQFLQKSGYVVKDWGEYWNWTTINNKDGSWSVGARFMGAPPGGSVANVYVTCVMKQSGDNWRLEKLSRLL